MERSLREKRWDTSETVKFLLKEIETVKKSNENVCSQWIAATEWMTKEKNAASNETLMDKAAEWEKLSSDMNEMHHCRLERLLWGGGRRGWGCAQGGITHCIWSNTLS